MVPVESEEEHNPLASSTINIAIRPLDSSMNRAAFACTDDELTKYFTGVGVSTQERTLEHDLAQGVTKAHVMLDRNTDEILGFFTLSSLSIPRDHLPSAAMRRNQLSDISTTLLGRMAVCSRLEGKGYGGRLLIAALLVAQKAAEYVGSSAIVVDPKRDELVSFYERYKFVRLKNPQRPLRMFLPMKTAAQVAAGAGLA